MTLAAVAASDVQVATPDLVIDLSRFAATIDAARLDAAVIKAVKINILDTLSCALAGSSATAIAEVSALVRAWGGAAQVDLFVFGGKFPAHHAAWVNGGMSHARDYDDTHDGAIPHAGVTAVPAAIAAGQLRGKLSGADLIFGGRCRSRGDLPPRRRHPSRYHCKRLHLHVAARVFRRHGGRRTGARPDGGGDEAGVRHRPQFGRRQSSGHA